MVQWWEHSPPTNVARVWFPDSASYVGWVCCWFSSLLWEFFLRVLRLSTLLKNQHFQISIRSGECPYTVKHIWSSRHGITRYTNLQFLFTMVKKKNPRNGQIIAVKIVKPPYARPTLPNRLAGLHGRPVLANGKPPKSSGNAACYRW